MVSRFFLFFPFAPGRVGGLLGREMNGRGEQELTFLLFVRDASLSQNGKNYRHIMNSVESVKDFCELSLVKMQEVSYFSSLFLHRRVESLIPFFFTRASQTDHGNGRWEDCVYLLA